MKKEYDENQLVYSEKIPLDQLLKIKDANTEIEKFLSS